MFNASKDILNLAVALAVLTVALFICWLLYYLISGLKRVNKVGKKIEDSVNKVDELIELSKNKIKQSGSYLFLLSKVASEAVDYFKQKKEKKEEAQKTKIKKDKK